MIFIRKLHMTLQSTAVATTFANTSGPLALIPIGICFAFIYTGAVYKLSVSKRLVSELGMLSVAAKCSVTGGMGLFSELSVSGRLISELSMLSVTAKCSITGGMGFSFSLPLSKEVSWFWSSPERTTMLSRLSLFISYTEMISKSILSKCDRNIQIISTDDYFLKLSIPSQFRKTFIGSTPHCKLIINSFFSTS